MNTAVARVNLNHLPVLAKRLLDHASLPKLYIEARSALKKCVKIDELKDIKDKHDAIAHYAKQIKDKTLLFYAEKIKLRAFERIGELLKEIPEYDARKAMGAKNGIAPATVNRAYEAAHVPANVRNKLIEQIPPVSCTVLARYGQRYMPGIYGAGFSHYKRRESAIQLTIEYQANELIDYISSVNEDLNNFLNGTNNTVYTMGMLARAADPSYLNHRRKALIDVIEKLDEFESNLPSDSFD